MKTCSLFNTPCVKLVSNLWTLAPLLGAFQFLTQSFSIHKTAERFPDMSPPGLLQCVMLSPPFSNLYNFSPILIKPIKLEHTDLNKRYHLNVFQMMPNSEQLSRNKDGNSGKVIPVSFLYSCSSLFLLTTLAPLCSTVTNIFLHHVLRSKLLPLGGVVWYGIV